MAGISPVQFFILSFNAAFGVGMATIPRALGEVSQEDMWLSVILGGAVLMFAVWTAAKLSSYFPRHTCLEYNRILLGPLLGQLVNILLLVVIIIIPVVSIRSFGLAVKIFLFELTPPQVTVAILILLLLYGAQHGLSPLIRLQQFLFLPTYCLFIPLILLGFTAVNTSYYLPFMAEGVIPVLKGLEPSWYAYTGPEFIIAFLYPFVTRQEAVLKWSVACAVALTVLNTLIVVVTQGILGPHEAANLLVPTIIAYREVEIPDTFIERLDGYFMLLWIPLIFTCMLNWVYLAGFGAARLLKLESSRPVIILLGPLFYYLILAQATFPVVSLVSKWENRAIMAWSLVIVPLLLGIAWLREKRRNIVE